MSNKAFHRTAHKVRRPVNADVGSNNMKILIIALLLSTTLCASAQEPVASVLGKAIYRTELMPDEKLTEIKKADLSEEEYAQWQIDYPAERLSQLIHEPIMQKYMDEHDLVVSDQDLVAYLKQGDNPIPINVLGKEGKAFFRAIIESRLSAKSLFEEYGGRVAVSSFGFADAVDAREAFLRQRAQEGTFSINDPALREAFWRNTTNDWLDATLTEEKAREMFNRHGFPMDKE